MLFFLHKFKIYLTIAALSLATATEYYTGCGGYSLSFDGKGNYVKIQAPLCSAVNPFELTNLTYEIWFYFYQYKNPYQWIIGQGGDYGVRVMREGTTNNIGFVNANGADKCFQSLKCENVTYREWHHVAFAYNGSHFFLYCDGKLLKENVINCTGQGGPGKWDTSMDIGQDHKQPKTRNLFGILEEMRIWKRFLSIDEINEKRFRSLTENERKDPDLTMYYTFDQGDGDTLKDDSLYADKINMEGNLGGTGDDYRLSNRPSWVKSSLTH